MSIADVVRASKPNQNDKKRAAALKRKIEHAQAMISRSEEMFSDAIREANDFTEKLGAKLGDARYEQLKLIPENVADEWEDSDEGNETADFISELENTEIYDDDLDLSILDRIIGR